MQKKLSTDTVALLIACTRKSCEIACANAWKFAAKSQYSRHMQIFCYRTPRLKRITVGMTEHNPCHSEKAQTVNAVNLIRGFFRVE